MPPAEPTLASPAPRGLFPHLPEGVRPVRASNRTGVDYGTFARALGPPAVPIVDFHAHINGPRAALVYRDVARAFGIARVYTQVRINDAHMVRDILGDFVRFIAFPNFRAEDRRKAFAEGYLADIQRFRDELDARFIKLWNSPRLRELLPGDAGKDVIEFDSPWRVEHVTLARSLGMGVMVHVADPDTWYKAKYSDASIFGTKRDAYRGLEVMLARFPDIPWIAAHMGGSPEDLSWLDTLLTRYPHLRLDCSATKWIIRELSKHPASRTREFFQRWRGRIIFGSDIVAVDEHLVQKPPLPPVPKSDLPKDRHPMGDLADSPESAFDLYASRYAMLRSLFEREGEAESLIADPDLPMVDPTITQPLPAPLLRGIGLGAQDLRVLYQGAWSAMTGDELAHKDAGA